MEYDVVVVLKGPPESIVIREKSRVAGIWMNSQSSESARTIILCCFSFKADQRNCGRKNGCYL